ncbi:DUF5133 domain-containing protein [Streptomyces sp. NPDC051135]|uniref:DUF5133 domain-containing protein n=1 Tax=unclassified Streptomyces TaxID=2593676 RepID=UPI00341CBE09
MLMPHPAELRRLLAEYETAATSEPADATGEPGPRTRDLAYTLCVSTGTRDVQGALEAARRQLAAPLVPVPVPGGTPADVVLEPVPVPGGAPADVVLEPAPVPGGAPAGVAD